MKLYHAPGTCSFAVLQVLHELELPFEIELVDLRSKRTLRGRDFLTVNPNGYVPALELDDGEVLLEAPAILQYLADLRPDAQLAPPPASLDRVRLQSHLNFASAELHKSFGVFFAPVQPEGDARSFASQRLSARLDQVESKLLGAGPWLTGERFTIADAYTAVVASWIEAVGLDRTQWPQIDAYVDRFFDRPSAHAARRHEEDDAKAGAAGAS